MARYRRARVTVNTVDRDTEQGIGAKVLVVGFRHLGRGRSIVTLCTAVRTADSRAPVVRRSHWDLVLTVVVTLVRSARTSV